jgi:predicted DNA-binding transcriptional regulator YafY
VSHVDLTTRISWVHELLSKKKYPSAADISEQFDVSNMVAYRDLDFLKYILKAPLQYDYEKEGHYYTKKFKLPELNVTEGELVAMLLLDQLRRFYSKTELDESIGKGLEILQESLREPVTIDLASLEQVLQVEIEPFPQVDLDVFASLVQAIRNNESVIIRYFSGQKAVVVEKPCDPYNVMKFKDHWYLVAFCHEKQDYRDFLCSRILEVERTNTTFLPDPDFSLEQHKKDSQLFASDAPPIEVVAEFDKYAAHWIRLRDVHPSQKIVERSDGSLEVSFRVSSMENIVRWILSFGEHARILAPLELQERVRRTISRMNYLYNRF